MKISIGSNLNLKRAVLMGFDISKIWYHGSDANITNFNVDAKSVQRCNNPSGVYLTPYDWEALEYGKNVYALYTRAKHPYVDAKSIVTHNMAALYAKLLKAHTSYNDDWIDSEIVPAFVKSGVFKDVSGDIKRDVMEAGGYDSWKDGRHLCVFDTTMLRSVDAKFDESKKYCSDIRC